MASIKITRLDGEDMTIHSQEAIQIAMQRGWISGPQALRAIADLMMAENIEFLRNDDDQYDPNFTEELAAEAAQTIYDSWTTTTTTDPPLGDPDEAKRRALEAQELGAELTSRGLGAAESIMRRDVMDRFPGFGQATPIARAGMAPYGQTQDALVNFFANLAPTSPGSETDWSQAATPPTFSGYLAGLAGGQPTVESLRANVGNVQRILANDYEALGGASARGIHYAFQEPWTQLAAAIQPGLRAIAPALRGAYRRGAGQHQESWQAQNPELRFLDFAQQAGYF
jgi:hypothetical protein